MKKFIISVLLILPVIAYSQVDSLTQQELIKVGVKVIAIGISTLIPGVPNEIIVSVLSILSTLALAGLHRIKTIKRWKKSGKLKQKETK